MNSEPSKLNDWMDACDGTVDHIDPPIPRVIDDMTIIATESWWKWFDSMVGQGNEVTVDIRPLVGKGEKKHANS